MHCRREMSGFNHAHVVESDKKFRCGICHLLYREPVQNIKTGKRFCKSCIEEFTGGDTGDYRPDNAVRREMEGLCVYCEQCRWKGNFKLLQVHLCPPPTNVYEENMSMKEELAVAEKKIFDFTQQSSELKEKISALEGTMFVDLGELDDLRKADVVTIKLSVPEVENQPPQEKELVPTSSSDFETITSELEQSILEVAEGQTKVEEALDESSTKLEIKAKHLETLSKWSALQSQWDFSDNAGFETTKNRSLDFHFSNGVGPSPNGSKVQCHLKISHMAQMLENAREHPDLPIETPPWPTHPCGYWIQAYIYLNGYQHSLDQSPRSQVSIFMKTLHGPYDNYLKWPLEATLTFCLLNQKGKNARPWIKSCRSDLDCPAFKRRPPLKSPDVNIVSGILDFIPIEKMIEDFIKDDTIMIEMSLRPMR